MLLHICDNHIDLTLSKILTLKFIQYENSKCQLLQGIIKQYTIQRENEITVQRINQCVISVFLAIKCHKRIVPI